MVRLWFAGRDEPPVRTLLADDHPVYVKGLARALEDFDDLEVIAICENGDQAMEEIRDKRPDVAVLDRLMPGTSSLDILSLIEEEELPTRIAFLSGGVDPQLAVNIVSHKATTAYILKTEPAEEIARTIVRAAHSDVALGPEVQRALAEALQEQAEKSLLTRREREVLELTAKGMARAEIAEVLVVSEATIRTHLRRTYEKLGVSGAAAAVFEAYRRGMIGPDV